MRAYRAYLFGGGLALPLLALLAGLEVPPVAASPSKAITDVNRTLKGDRLPTVVPADANSSVRGLPAPQAHPRLPEGCEAAVSAMTRSPLARMPARCIS